MSAQLTAYLRVMRFHRPWPILLILLPTCWGLFLGPNLPSLKITLAFMLGAIFARAGGCVINDYFDRDIDGLVERTKARPLQLKSVTPRETLILFFILMMLSFICLLFLHNEIILLGFVAFFFCLLYPLAKRVTYFPQVVLGAAFNFGLVMAFVQVNGHLSLLAWGYYLFSILWTVHYDTLYALSDYEDDLKIGVKSIPTFFKDGIFAFLLCSSIALVILIFAIWSMQGWSVMRVLLLLALIVFLGMQYAVLLLKGRKSGLMLFNQHVGFGVIILLGVIL